MADGVPWLEAGPMSWEAGNCPDTSVARTQIQQLSPAALAYLGDAVYELYVRRAYLVPAKRIQDYHQAVVAQVRAEAQAQYLQQLETHLTEAEKTIVRRGRNATGKRSRPVDPEIYQQATSFEALIGYLYLTSPQRLDHLLSLLPLMPRSNH